MKRDMELIRKLVLAIEGSASGFAPREIKIDGYSDEQIRYHAHLMIQAGLAEGADVTHKGSSGPEAILNNLTWAGHEFAAAACDETRWRKAMGLVKERAGSVTISVLTQVLTALMKGPLGLP
jgi:hypothetical protein